MSTSSTGATPTSPSPVGPPRAFEARHRVFAVVLAVVCILLAGVVAQTADRLDADVSVVYVTADDGQPESLPFGEVAVVDVSLGAILQTRDERIDSAGRFVAVDVRTDGITENVPSLRVQLRAGGNVYEPLLEPAPGVEAGFTATNTWVFDLPADVIDELVVEIRELELITRTPKGVRSITRFDDDDVAGSAQTVVSPLPGEVTAR